MSATKEQLEAIATWFGPKCLYSDELGPHIMFGDEQKQYYLDPDDDDADNAAAFILLIQKANERGMRITINRFVSGEAGMYANNPTTREVIRPPITCYPTLPNAAIELFSQIAGGSEK